MASLAAMRMIASFCNDPNKLRGRFRRLGFALATFLAISVLGPTAPVAAQELSDDVRAKRAVLLEARAERLDDLFGELARTPRPAEARLVEGRIWTEWMLSGSATIDLMMGWAARAAQSGDHGVAFDYLDQIIVLVPDYAEAWNRRATLHFLRGDYDKSVADIEETLSREPRHFGALSGLGQIMLRQERPRLARDAFRRTLEIYPANRAAQEALAKLEEELSGDAL